jgi:hypothetical protein
MARGDLVCPIDGLVLGLPNWQYRGGTNAAETNDHFHITFVGTFDCNNGHRYQVEAGSRIVMQRIQ